MVCRYESVPVVCDDGDDALLEALHRDTSVKLRRTDTNTDLMIRFMPIGELLEPQLMPVTAVGVPGIRHLDRLPDGTWELSCGKPDDCEACLEELVVGHEIFGHLPDELYQRMR